jgi:hypothetical protein
MTDNLWDSRTLGFCRAARKYDQEDYAAGRVALQGDTVRIVKNAMTKKEKYQMTPRVPHSWEARDRQIENGHVRVRITSFEPSDDPRTYTAVLLCGHGVRFNCLRDANRKTMRCPQCTEAHLAQETAGRDKRHADLLP